MLETLGLKSEEDLLQVIPEKHRVRGLLPIERGKTEPETWRKLFRLGETNHPAARLVSFLGGGVYDHTVPSVVKNIASRPEFATAYTPYQPEASQGTLQVIFEFQTHIARLTRLPVANASMYDGASALAEACLMAAKITRRDVVLVPQSINPRYRRVLESYITGQSVEIRAIPVSAQGDIDIAAMRKRWTTRWRRWWCRRRIISVRWSGRGPSNRTCTRRARWWWPASIRYRCRC
jgi:glycine dehydrogenase subunit 1